MRINCMEVVQAGNSFRIFVPQGFPVCDVLMPPNGQSTADYKTLEVVTRVLALRWGIMDNNKKSTF
jgi:hypothetical protein